MRVIKFSLPPTKYRQNVLSTGSVTPRLFFPLLKEKKNHHLLVFISSIVYCCVLFRVLDPTKTKKTAVLPPSRLSKLRHFPTNNKRRREYKFVRLLQQSLASFCLSSGWGGGSLITFLFSFFFAVVVVVLVKGNVDRCLVVSFTLVVYRATNYSR